MTVTKLNDTCFKSYTCLLQLGTFDKMSAWLQNWLAFL